MTQVERDQQDAARWRALMKFFKTDYIWYNVLCESDTAGFHSIEEVIDDVIEHQSRRHERHLPKQQRRY